MSYEMELITPNSPSPGESFTVNTQICCTGIPIDQKCEDTGVSMWLRQSTGEVVEMIFDGVDMELGGQTCSEDFFMHTTSIQQEGDYELAVMLGADTYSKPFTVTSDSGGGGGGGSGGGDDSGGGGGDDGTDDGGNGGSGGTGDIGTGAMVVGAGALLWWLSNR